MGWKNVKEHYRIGHTVQVTEAGICIGSPYIHNIIVIGLDGTITREYKGTQNDDLARYQREFRADPETLKRLVEAPDSFEKAITVYTFEGGKIIEKACEALGWPNVTHDGELMHDNTFSPIKAQVVAWAKRNADLGIQAHRRNLEQLETKIEDYRGRLTTEIAIRERLEADYPDVVAEIED